jgi:DbpA RNA binding domain
LPPIKLQRYRLDIGKKQKLDLETLQAVLIEESGVDRNNIQNVSIRNDYTLLELPDEMPSDIFLHLKNISINGYKLNIKRLKLRKETPYKSSNHFRRRRF